MLKRIITSVVALGIFFGIIIAGTIPFQIAMGLVILLMLHEVFGAITDSAALKASGYIMSLILMAGMYFGMAEPAMCAMLVITMVMLIALHGKKDYREVFSAAFMTVYITLFMGCIALLKGIGTEYMAFVFIIAWGSDTAAYFCGTFLGKHKLIPHVSPKKTVEGSVGAVVFAALFTMLYVFIMDRLGMPIGGNAPAAIDYIKLGALGMVGSAASQIGDLCASAVKRDTGIKDYGSIFPGHGGFMDRFDSVMFVAPFVYFCCLFVII